MFPEWLKADQRDDEGQIPLTTFEQRDIAVLNPRSTGTCHMYKTKKLPFIETNWRWIFITCIKGVLIKITAIACEHMCRLHVSSLEPLLSRPRGGTKHCLGLGCFPDADPTTRRVSGLFGSRSRRSEEERRGRQGREGSTPKPVNQHGEPQLRSTGELQGTEQTIAQAYPD